MKIKGFLGKLIVILGMTCMFLLYACHNGDKDETTIDKSTSAPTTEPSFPDEEERDPHPLEEDEHLMLWYKFRDADGQTIKDRTGNGYDGKLYNIEINNEGAAVFNGENSYVELPHGLLKDVQNITIVIDVLVDEESIKPFWLFTFGSKLDSGDVNSKYLGLLYDSSHRLRVPMTLNRWEHEQNTIMQIQLVRNAWLQFAFTLNGNTGTLYQDGMPVGRNFAISISPKDIEATIANYIGRPAYYNDRYFKGQVRDFKIYSRALTQNEIEELSALNDERAVLLDYESFQLPKEIDHDINLPRRGKYGSYISWVSKDPKLITDKGEITRPSYLEGNKTVILEATFYRGQIKRTKEFEVVILAELSPEEKLLAAKDKLWIPFSKDIRGNIYLPTLLDDGVQITWESSNNSIISTEPGTLGYVYRPTKDTTVRLKATLTYEGNSVEKTFELTVRAKPKQKPYTAYLFVYFRGEGFSTGEQIYFGVSRDGLNWQPLNQNNPVLISTVGEKRVRDPYILRSPEGDRFFMVATDLSIYYRNYDWWGAQTDGSQSIVVWESKDLVNWSEPRLVKVALDDAGNTWAPEFVYDFETGEYVIFWASRTASDKHAKHRIYYTKTRDFYHFTEPQIFYEKDFDIIDTTIVYHDGYYYRLTKNEVTQKIIFEKGKSLFGEYETIYSPSLDEFQYVEGPFLFKTDDQWILFLDEFMGKGYFPMVTEDLDSGIFRVLSAHEYRLPPGARHGSVIPITEDEYQALISKWG